MIDLTKKIETALGIIDTRVDELQNLVDTGKLPRKQHLARVAERDVLLAVSKALRGESHDPRGPFVKALIVVARAALVLSASGAVTHIGELGADRVVAALDNLDTSVDGYMASDDDLEFKQIDDSRLGGLVQIVQSAYHPAVAEDLPFDKDTGKYMMRSIDAYDAAEDVLEDYSSDVIQRVSDLMVEDGGDQWVSNEDYDSWFEVRPDDR